MRQLYFTDVKPEGAEWPRESSRPAQGKGKAKEGRSCSGGQTTQEKSKMKKQHDERRPSGHSPALKPSLPRPSPAGMSLLCCLYAGQSEDRKRRRKETLQQMALASEEDAQRRAAAPAPLSPPSGGPGRSHRLDSPEGLLMDSTRRIAKTKALKCLIKDLNTGQLWL